MTDEMEKDIIVRVLYGHASPFSTTDTARADLAAALIRVITCAEEQNPELRQGMLNMLRSLEGNMDPLSWYRDQCSDLLHVSDATMRSAFLSCLILARHVLQRRPMISPTAMAEVIVEIFAPFEGNWLDSHSWQPISAPRSRLLRYWRPALVIGAVMITLFLFLRLF